jgi:chromosome segregation ATPase
MEAQLIDVADDLENTHYDIDDAYSQLESLDTALDDLGNALEEARGHLSQAKELLESLTPEDQANILRSIIDALTGSVEF